MKRVLYVLFLFLSLFYFREDYFSFDNLSNSLAKNEIALTFIDDSLFLITLNEDNFLISMKDNISHTIIQKYHLSNIPIYSASDMNDINGLNITYNDSNEFSLEYKSKKFCIGKFYGCDFTYLYENDSYIGAAIYFYNSKTAHLVKDINSKTYFIKPIISILWDEKNHMIITY